MSGNRAITLSLSVRDAATVKQELEKIGPAGEQALQRLEAAAQRAQGRAGGGGMAGFNQAIGQAGFQIQDFAVQVQGGTNALTALSQQGSQLLGVFGPGGAIAGAILTVGLLTTQLLTGGETAEQANKRVEESYKGLQKVAEDVARVVREINDLFLTAGERGAAAANAQRGALIEQTRRLLDVTIQRNEGNAIERAEAQRELASIEAGIARRRSETRARTGSNVSDADRGDESRLFAARARLQGIDADISRQSARLGELGETLRRAENAGVVGNGEYGPPNPDTPESRAAARRAAAAGAAAGRRNAAAARQLSERDIASEERGNAAAIREFEQALRSIETPLERHFRQIVELGELQERLREAGQPMAPEDYDRLVQGYDQQLEQAEAAANRTSGAARELGMTFSSAFEDAIVKGKELSEVLQGVAEDLARIILRQSVVNPLANAASGALSSAGSWFTGLFSGSAAPSVSSALGNAFLGGRLTPFALGGVVDRATVLPMALMGEAGPEAVMPLDRDSSGKLGVRAKGGGGGMFYSPTFNIDARGADPSVVPLFRQAVEVAVARSKAELLAEIQRGGRAAKVVGRRA
jgi:hypothetical protein